MMLHVLLTMLAGWMQRHQHRIITYLIEENRILNAHLGGRRLRLTAAERRRLAALGHPLGRQRQQEVATLVTPDTLMRWYRLLIARKFDGSRHRKRLGRPPGRGMTLDPVFQPYGVPLHGMRLGASQRLEGSSGRV